MIRIEDTNDESDLWSDEEMLLKDKCEENVDLFKAFDWTSDQEKRARYNKCFFMLEDVPELQNAKLL